MRDNVFLENKKELELADFMNYADGSRGNLGKDIPVTIYRLLEYSIREQLIRQFGKETQIQVFQDAGDSDAGYHKAGRTIPETGTGTSGIGTDC